jgi:hypothetical protein
MIYKSAIFSVGLSILLLCIFDDLTLNAEEIGNNPAIKSEAKNVNRSAHKSRPKQASNATSQTDQLPCPRANYKDDPVCFGENDPDQLPLPSSSSVATTAKKTKEVSVEPIGSLNNPVQSPVFLTLPNPNPLGTQFGGGAKVNVPF